MPTFMSDISRTSAESLTMWSHEAAHRLDHRSLGITHGAIGDASLKSKIVEMTGVCTTGPNPSPPSASTSCTNTLRQYISSKALLNRSSLCARPSAAHISAHERRVGLDTAIDRWGERCAGAVGGSVDFHYWSSALARIQVSHIPPSAPREI
jgi:hypothetical protein